MNRQVQTTGVRKYFGADLIDLQAEPLSILDAFLGYAGACVVKGCEVTKNADNTFNVAAGLVALEATDHGRRGDEQTRRIMVMPFSGIQNTAMPLYLTATEEIITRQYKDGKIKPVAYSYRAQASAVQPAAGTAYLQITETSRPTWLEVVQDALHRMVTDAQIKQWDAKPTALELEKYVKKVGAAVNNELTMTRTQNGARFQLAIGQDADFGNNTLALLGKNAKGVETALLYVMFSDNDPTDETSGMAYFSRLIFATSGLFTPVVQANEITAETVAARLIGVAEMAEMDDKRNNIRATYARKDEIPTKLPADGGHADTAKNLKSTDGFFLTYTKEDVTQTPFVLLGATAIDNYNQSTVQRIDPNKVVVGKAKNAEIAEKDGKGKIIADTYLPKELTNTNGQYKVVRDVDHLGSWLNLVRISDNATVGQLRVNIDGTLSFYSAINGEKSYKVWHEGNFRPDDKAGTAVATQQANGLLSKEDKAALDDISNVAGKPVIFAEVTAIPSANGTCTIKSKTATGVTVSIERTLTGFFVRHNLGAADYFVMITPHSGSFNYYVGKSENNVFLSTSTAWPFNASTPCWEKFSVAIFKYK